MFSHRKLLYALLSLLILGSTSCSPRVPLLDISAVKLKGTQWQLNSYGPRGSEIAVANGAQITMAFTGDDKMGGTDGCNTFEGNYQVEYKVLAFQNLQSTTAVCKDPTLMRQEIEYLQALSKANRYEIRGDQLIIWYDHEKYTLIFTRSRPPGLVGAVFGKG